MPTALIVEDEPEANRLLSMLVQLRGYQTESAFTGAEALEMILRRPPDVVFLDLMLPDLTGFEVCRRIKTRSETSLIPVVMVTARVEADNRKACFSVGADDYVPKPYTPDQIFKSMADAVLWRRNVDRNGNDGTIRLDSRSDDALRQLAQLRNLLVARAPLGPEALCRVCDGLREIIASAEDWGRANRVDLVATLAYHLDSDQVIFTMRDVGGWLSLSRQAPEVRWPRSLPAARFDQFRVSEDGRAVTFLRRFSTGGDPADSVG